MDAKLAGTFFALLLLVTIVTIWSILSLSSFESGESGLYDSIFELGYNEATVEYEQLLKAMRDE